MSDSKEWHKHKPGWWHKRIASPPKEPEEKFYQDVQFGRPFKEKP